MSGLPNPATRMTQQWIADALRMNPCQAVLDPNGQPTGNFRTCPVRLGWNTLFEPEKPQRQKDGTMSEGGKYVTNIIFPVGADISLLMDAWRQFAYQHFPGSYNAQDGQFYGLREGFRKQDEKCMKHEGFMPGGFWIGSKTKFQPSVVMPGPVGADGQVQWMPVTDPKKVYPGVWAICTINPYKYDSRGNAGVAWGLQNVCLISDDQPFASTGGRSAERDFKGVQIAPNADFSRMMSNAPIAGPAGAGGPMGVMPPAQQIGGPAPAYRQPAAPMPVQPLPSAAGVTDVVDLNDVL